MVVEDLIKAESLERRAIAVRLQTLARPDVEHGHVNTPSGLTLEQFISEYDYLVRAVIIRRLRTRPYLLNRVEDIRQQVWLEFIRGPLDPGTKEQVYPEGGYIFVFDPRKSSPRTFMFEFTSRRVMQYLSRSKRTPTDNSFSIQNQDEDDFQVGIVDPETHPSLGVDDHATLEFDDLVERAEDAVHRQRIRGKRDLPWVWYLARRGYRQDEIAAEMNLSEGTISICMDIIRQIPEVKELREWAVENGLLQHLTY